MKRKYDLYLKDILDSIRKVKRYTGGIEYDEFADNEMIIDAVIRNFEIIGEAVSQLPVTVKEEYDEVSWREVKDFRNVIIHKYWTVDTEIAWEIVQDYLPELEEKIGNILEKL